MAVALLVLSAPIAFPGGRPDVDPDDPQFSVAFANMYRNNASAAAGEAVLAPDADVLGVVELNQAMAERLEQLGVEDRYPYRLVQPHWSSEGLALYSRFPIEGGEVRRIGSRLGLEATLDVDGQPVRFLLVHPFPPVSDGRTSREWADSLDAIGDAATTPGPPTVVVGDFNASRWHPPFRDLLGRGLRDVHEWMGRGFSTSWPVAWDLPPFVRLDHALLGAGRGSHRGARAPRTGQRPPRPRGRPRRHPGLDLSVSISALNARPRCDSACFSASDISAKVRPSPSAGTKSGS